MGGQDGLFTVGHHTVTEVQELGIGQRLGEQVRNLILCQCGQIEFLDPAPFAEETSIGLQNA